MNFLTINYAPAGEPQHSEGRLCVPMVMAREQVMSGSGGPLMYPADTLQRTAELWEGIPITVDHPMFNGRPISAANPGAKVIGTVRRPRFDGRLVADCCLNVSLVNYYEPDIVQRIRSGQRIELSTGMNCDVTWQRGSFGGVRYDGVVTNLVPDHLAILPHHVGACSLRDGCGVLANMDPEIVEEVNEMRADGIVVPSWILNRKQLDDWIEGAPDWEALLSSPLLNRELGSPMSDEAPLPMPQIDYKES